MIRGLVIGKFMPVHSGHLGLIKFASNHCDEVLVSMSYTNQDPILSSLRLSWLKEVLADQVKIKIETIPDDFDDESLPWPERTAIWAQVLKKRYPTIHLVFSSESYGEYLAYHLGARSILFDQTRQKFPVSASLIRKNPVQYWDYIPLIIRPYFVSNICFYGPESTGKSTMAKHLAEKYKTEYVPEVAKEIISSNHFTIEDIIQIGYAQTNRAKEKLKTASRFLFCDTDLITTEIYSRHYLGIVPSVLFELETEVKYDHYFLFDIDVPWVNDGLRDLGERRHEMLNVFKAELERRKIKFTWVTGNWTERERIITRYLESPDNGK